MYDFGTLLNSIQTLSASQVSDHAATLSWTATGDDGPSGQAAGYLARYSLSPITSESQWQSASPVAGVLPRPKASGSVERLTVPGLTGATQYYFAIRVVDASGNLSPVSNNAAAFTLATPGRTLQVPSQFPTISAAVSSAESGDTVIVAPGYYVESIGVTKPDLRIQARAGPGGTFLTPLEGNPAFVITADNVCVTGFTFQGQTGIVPRDAAVTFVGVRDGCVRQNVFTNNYSNISVRESTGVIVANNNVEAINYYGVVS